MKHPVRRWSSLIVSDGSTIGIASGQELDGLKISVPRTGYLTMIAGRAFDPSLVGAETLNQWAAEAIEIRMRVNNESPTNFQWIGLPTLAGSPDKPRDDVLIWIEKNDDLEIDVRNVRTAGANRLYCALEFGWSDPSDVEGCDMNKPHEIIRAVVRELVMPQGNAPIGANQNPSGTKGRG